jgi:hypothetical protein
MAKELEDEVSWLRHRAMRLRTILRWTKDARVETELKSLITEVESRLEALGTKQTER